MGGGPGGLRWCRGRGGHGVWSDGHSEGCKGPLGPVGRGRMEHLPPLAEATPARLRVHRTPEVLPWSRKHEVPPPAPAHTLWAVSPCPALLYRLVSFPPTPTRHRWLVLPEPRCQIGQPPHGPHIADREGTGLRLPDQDDELLAPRHPGVEQIARQHRVVLGRQRGDNRGVLRALAL